jgi:hypothetical protein
MEKGLLWIEKGLLSLGMVALFAMMCLTTVDAVWRYLFNSPIVGAYEITEKYLMLTCIFLGMSFTYRGQPYPVTILMDRMQFDKDLYQPFEQRSSPSLLASSCGNIQYVRVFIIIHPGPFTHAPWSGRLYPLGLFSWPVPGYRPPAVRRAKLLFPGKGPPVMKRSGVAGSKKKDIMELLFRCPLVIFLSRIPLPLPWGSRLVASGS